MTTSDDEEDTETKLAILASIFTRAPQDTLLDILIRAEGKIPEAVELFLDETPSAAPFGPPAKRRKTADESNNEEAKRDAVQRLKWTDSAEPARKVQHQTLHLYQPDQIAALTPCTLIPNILPLEIARSLLTSLLHEAQEWKANRFRLFERVVQTKSTSCLYVDREDPLTEKEYIYNGSNLDGVRKFNEALYAARPIIEVAVNKLMRTRKREKYEYAGPFEANVAFCNLYANAAECVGYHADQLTYLGPHPTIASISLGCEREFRIRKIEPGVKNADTASAPIGIHLPHNSLLKSWKHSIHPATVITPHPLAGTARLNITYRHYRQSYGPRFTPACKCGVEGVLRCVMKRGENLGRYYWTCHLGRSAEEEGGCDWFEWAEMDGEGENVHPLRNKKREVQDPADKKGPAEYEEWRGDSQEP